MRHRRALNPKYVLIGWMVCIGLAGAQTTTVRLADSRPGKHLRIAKEDRSTGSAAWLAFSGPPIRDSGESRNAAKKILLKTPLFTMLIFLPGFTLYAFAIGRGIRGTVKLGLVTLAGIAVPGYVLFFVYVLSAKAGYIISAILPYLLGSLLFVLLYRLTPAERRQLRAFLIPLALTLFASAGTLSLGYLYGGIGAPDVTARNRFSHPLPPDDTISYLFAEDLQHGPVPKPMLGDWLSSDRPPLQAGMILALAPWINHRQLWYQVASVVIQSLWIFAVWLLMRGFRISGVTAALVIATIYFNGFIIVNTFFTWPKLLAAAYMVAFAIPLLAARPRVGRGSWLLRCLMAFLLACSLLAHGGTVFALLGLSLLMLVRYRKWMLKETCIVLMIAALFYCPWIGYQKFVDPPGDRLLKFHLAGVTRVTAEPAWQTIHEAYSRQTFGQWLASKEANAGAVFGHELEYWNEIPGFFNPLSKRQIRVLEFYYLLPTLGFAGFGIAGLLLRWKKNRIGSEMMAAERLLLWAFGSIIPWILLMFKPSSTVLHQGAYAMVLMAMAGSILACRAVAPRLAICLCLFQCIFHWLVYEPDLGQAGFPQFLPESMNQWMIALHLVSLCGFFATLALSLKRSEAATSMRNQRGSGEPVVSKGRC